MNQKRNPQESKIQGELTTHVIKYQVIVIRQSKQPIFTPTDLMKVLSQGSMLQFLV
jgi:hypothetical protein